MPGFDPDKMVVVIGMPRGGTTSLYHIFDAHPGVFTPFRKETAYFSYNHYKGEAWYRGLYAERPDDQPAFDISPQYFCDLRSIERMKKLVPGAKLVLSMRDPVEWIVSSYLQTNKFEKKPDFAAFVEHYTITGAREKLHFRLADGYVERAVKAFREAFGANLLIYDFEAFRKEPVRVLNAIERFIGVEPYFSAATYEGVKVNSTYQNNLRWLTWILSREQVISAIDAVFPRPVIRKARLAFDRMTMPKSPPETPLLDPEDLALAERRLGPDRRWVKSLFADRSMFLGDGSPFDAAAVAA
jgi:hypothetical protein